MTQLGIERWEEVLRDHARILGGAISKAGGNTAHSEGDSFFAVFDVSTDAVTAAVSAELELARRVLTDARISSAQESTPTS